ncbi:hypothetical protein [Allomesorhizobium alhagi]|uniref:hypothetical protein n=1 Tax=Allomesorhizobium alhagi TaxID=475067 RepID=UPI001300BFA2|nr:hypothetical protein [Mesorhizobium alhagi]
MNDVLIALHAALVLEHGLAGFDQRLRASGIVAIAIIDVAERCQRQLVLCAELSSGQTTVMLRLDLELQVLAQVPVESVEGPVCLPLRGMSLEVALSEEPRSGVKRKLTARKKPLGASRL